MSQRFVSATVLAIFLACVADAGPASGQQPPAPFRAGASVVDITPEKFPVIVNAMFVERSATKAVDPLHARCLVLDDGRTRLAIAVVDTCMLPRDLIDHAKELASRETGIPVDRMLISATHTHSAPAAMACLGSRADPEYVAWLPARIAGGIARAAQHLAPAQAGWAIVEDWMHTFNRRWIRRPDRLLVDPFGVRNVRANMHPGHQSPDAIGPSGPVDPALSILAVRTPEGRPLALLANYSQHYYGSPLLSADYSGRFAGHLAKKLGADERFVGIMSQGTSGDLMWMDYGAPRRDIGYDAYAQEIAGLVHDAYRGITWEDRVSLAMAERRLTLDFRVPDPERLAWARAVATKLEGRLPRTHPEIYALEAMHLHERPRAELKLQALRVGQLGIVAIPNEVFAITGLKIKAQSPLPATFNIELANGAEGYIPPPEQHQLGGYTTWPARTAGLAPDAEPRIVEAALSLLEEVAGQKRRPLVDRHGPYANAILEARPRAYWRLNEIAGLVAQDASPHARHAAYQDGVALYLPGAGSGAGISPNPRLTPSNFSGPQAINRAPHFAGGYLKAEELKLGADYSVELWIWNGLSATAREVTGVLFACRGDGTVNGDMLGITGTASEFAGRLFVTTPGGPSLLTGKTELTLKEWHHVVFIRQGRKVALHLDGNPAPEINGETEPGQGEHLSFGGAAESAFRFEGKLDEVAVFGRALSVSEVAAHWNASGSHAPP